MAGPSPFRFKLAASFCLWTVQGRPIRDERNPAASSKTDLSCDGSQGDMFLHPVERQLQRRQTRRVRLRGRCRHMEKSSGQSTCSRCNSTSDEGACQVALRSVRQSDAGAAERCGSIMQKLQSSSAGLFPGRRQAAASMHECKEGSSQSGLKHARKPRWRQMLIP